MVARRGQGVLKNERERPGLMKKTNARLFLCTEQFGMILTDAQLLQITSTGPYLGNPGLLTSKLNFTVTANINK